MPPVALSLALTLLVLFDLLKPGYIILLDQAAGPQAPGLFGHDPVQRVRAPFNAVNLLFTAVAPYWVFQKIYIVAVFTAMGAGFYRLTDAELPGRLFGTVLYVVNPFTYIRFLTGQWGVLASYAAAPFALKGFLEFLDEPSRRGALRLAVLTTVVGVFQPHGFGVILLLYGILIMVAAARGRLEIRKSAQPGAVFLAAFAVLNTYWWVPLLTKGSPVLSTIGGVDHLFFSPEGTSGLGVVFDVAAMYGFWRGGVLLPIDSTPWVIPLFLVLMYLAVRGLLTERGDTWIKTGFAAAAVTGFFLAVGAASIYTRPLFEVLWNTVPVFRAFRDSQKFVGILVLSYAYLGATGLNQTLRDLTEIPGKLSTSKAHRLLSVVLVAAALLTPLAYTHTMPLGFSNQVETTWYPDEWHEASTYLKQNAPHSRTLVLPWHLYMDYSWLPNRVKRAGPLARTFFETPVLTGDNIEIPGSYTKSTRPESRVVESAFGLGPGEGGNSSSVGTDLARINVTHVLVLKEVDWKKYEENLTNQTSMEPVLENSKLKIYKNDLN